MCIRDSHEALYSAPLVRPAWGRSRRIGRRRWRGADHSASLGCRRRPGAAADNRGSQSPFARSARHPVAAGHEALCSAPLVRPAWGCGRCVGRRRRRGADDSASRAVGDAPEPPSPGLVTTIVPCARSRRASVPHLLRGRGLPPRACTTRLLPRSVPLPPAMRRCVQRLACGRRWSTAAARWAASLRLGRNERR